MWGNVLIYFQSLYTFLVFTTIKKMSPKISLFYKKSTIKPLFILNKMERDKLNNKKNLNGEDNGWWFDIHPKWWQNYPFFRLVEYIGSSLKPTN